MSGKRTKLKRKAFEQRNGFTPLDRDHEIYKNLWRKFKRGVE